MFLRQVATGLVKKGFASCGPQTNMDETSRYKNAHLETTDWDDAQRKIGNLPPLPEREVTPPMAAARSEEEEARDTSWMDRRSAVELEAMQDDSVATDDRFMEEYRCASAPNPIGPCIPGSSQAEGARTAGDGG
jgi:hypothetical protein